MSLVLFDAETGAVSSAVFRPRSARFSVTAQLGGGSIQLKGTNDPKGRTDPNTASWDDIDVEQTADFSADILSHLEFFRMEITATGTVSVWLNSDDSPTGKPSIDLITSFDSPA